MSGSNKADGEKGGETSLIFSAVNFNSLQTCISSIFVNMMNDSAVI